jgi:hypothetical protein
MMNGQQQGYVPPGGGNGTPAQPQQGHVAGGGAPVQQGPQPVNDIGFNQQVQNILFSRIDKLSEEEYAAFEDSFDSIITPETMPVLEKVFPELAMLLMQASAFTGQEPMIGGGQPAAGGAQQYAASGEVEENPLTSNGASRGLMG